MIWQVWAVLVLGGSAWAYVALIQKRAAPFTSLAMTGHFAVAAYGGFAVETQFTTSAEPGAAILCGLLAVIGVVVFVAAVTGQYGDEDELTTPDAGELRRHMEDS